MKKVRNTPTKSNSGDSSSKSSSSKSSRSSKGGSSFCSRLMLLLTVAFVAFAVFLGYNYSSLEHTRVTVGELGKEYFRNKQNLAIYTQQYEAQNARAALLFVHGFGEHQGRYAEFFKDYVENGVSVYALDLQGHGRSDGDRVHVINFDDYVDDVIQYKAIIQKKIGELPLFLMGNSMGGAVSCLTSLREKFRGVLYISPMFGVVPEVAKPHLVAISNVLAKILPKLQVPGEKLDQSTLSHSQEEVDAYNNDPLCYQGFLKVRAANQCLQATFRVQESAKSYTTPFFIAQSGDDHAVDPEAAKNFFANASSKDKKLTIYEGAYHHLTAEPASFDGGAERANKELLNWLLERI